MLNTAQFSSGKAADLGKQLQAAVFDENNTVKSYSKYYKDAEKITNIVNDTWLRVERDMCVRQCVQAEAFLRMQADADLYPYWQYVGVMDSVERPEHVALEAKIFRIGDPAGDACFPPNDWNCRCSGESTDEGKPLTNEQAKEFLLNDVDKDFRYNAAIQGPMPNTGSYFEELSSANKANAEVVVDEQPEEKEYNFEDALNTVKTKAKELHQDLGVQIEENIKATKPLKEVADKLYKDYTEAYVRNSSDLMDKVSEYKKVSAELQKQVNERIQLQKQYAIKAAEILLNRNPSTEFELAASKAQYNNIVNLKEGEKAFKKIINNDLLNGKANVTGLKERSRAYYRAGKIAITKKEDIPTICHELGHHLESSNKEYFESIKAYYNKRTAGEPIKRLRAVTGIRYSNSEVTKVDKFTKPYMGKWYINSKGEQTASEITSMWFTESLTNLQKFIEQDEDYFSTVYMLLNK